MNFLAYFFCRKSNRRKEYRKHMTKAAMQISKEMDLKKFIMRQRMQTIARLSLLSGRQIYLAVKMAQPIVHGGPESSPSTDSASCSSFDEAETK